MIQAHYSSKKQLEENIGKALRYSETSLFGPEFKANGSFTVADSSPKRKWFALVTMENSLIKKVA